MSSTVGYDFLHASLDLPTPPLAVVAQVSRVTGVSRFGDSVLAVPPGVAPISKDPLAHLLFALKHESLNLPIALLTLQHLSAVTVGAEFAARPSSQYARLACYLWELAHGVPLPDLPVARGAYVALFDPARFLTGPVTRSTRWRVDFNGLGSPGYCITVRRTEAIQALLAADILGQVQTLLSEIDPALLDRAVQWAYLSETDSSYAIERESATQDKRSAFASLLARAHEREPLTEDRLVALQNLCITNPREHAFEFRSQQNWLRNSLPGVLGVTYLPPPPALCLSLMAEIMAFANDTRLGVDALVRGALLSFAFVFAHPFMDGNGRLSRFLFHQAACQDERLATGLVLPVSVAMKRHEGDYLKALQSFSKPTRAFWQVTMAGEEVEATFAGAPELYRYWDGTDCVAFGLRMAREALEQDLRDECAFLLRFDRAWRAANEAVDMNNADLVVLVRSVVQQGGVLSINRRKKLLAKGHPEKVIDAAVRAIGAALSEVERSTSG